MEPRLVRFEGFERIHSWLTCGRRQELARAADARGRTDRHAWGSTAQTLGATDGGGVARSARPRRQRVGSQRRLSFTAYGADCVAVVDQLRAPARAVARHWRHHGHARRGRLRPRRIERAHHDVHRTNPAGVQRIRDFMSSAGAGCHLDEAADAIAAYTPHRPRA